VIEEKASYYRYNDIERIRKQLRYKEKLFDIPVKTTNRTVEDILKQESILPKYGALLFRLTNYFRPQNILQVGPTIGLSTLYLTSYAPGLKCISLENIPAYTSISKWVYANYARTPIDLRTGNLKESLPTALHDLGNVDFVYFNTPNEQNTNIGLFNECIKFAHKGTVFVFQGIQANRYMRELWEMVCAHPEITVSIDLFSMGIALLNKKIHKRNYTVYF